jgi:site-specific DNA-cytosine methylase
MKTLKSIVPKYEIRVVQVNSRDYGLAQERKRLYILGAVPGAIKDKVKKTSKPSMSSVKVKKMRKPSMSSVKGKRTHILKMKRPPGVKRNVSLTSFLKHDLPAEPVPDAARVRASIERGHKVLQERGIDLHAKQTDECIVDVAASYRFWQLAVGYCPTLTKTRAGCKKSFWLLKARVI